MPKRVDTLSEVADRLIWCRGTRSHAWDWSRQSAYLSRQLVGRRNMDVIVQEVRCARGCGCVKVITLSAASFEQISASLAYPDGYLFTSADDRPDVTDMRREVLSRAYPDGLARRGG